MNVMVTLFLIVQISGVVIGFGVALYNIIKMFK